MVTVAVRLPLTETWLHPSAHTPLLWRTHTGLLLPLPAASPRHSEHLSLPPSPRHTHTHTLFHGFHPSLLLSVLFIYCNPCSFSLLDLCLSAFSCTASLPIKTSTTYFSGLLIEYLFWPKQPVNTDDFSEREQKAWPEGVQLKTSKDPRLRHIS